MNRNNLIGLALVVIVLAGSGLSFWLQTGGGPDEGPGKPQKSASARNEDRKTASADTTRTAASSNATPAAIARALVARAAGALPPADTPVNEILAELKGQATNGNSAAACRLAFELERCYNMRILEQRVTRAMFRVEQGGLAGDALQAAQAEAERARERLYRVSDLCLGVPNEEKADAWRYLLQAARAGHGPSMMRYAAGAGLPEGRPTLEVIDGWIAYRDESQGFLDRAIEMGYPEAYEIGKNFYVRGGHWGLKVAPDRPKAVALQIALAQLQAPGDVAAVEKAVASFAANFKVSPEDVAKGRSIAEPFAVKLKQRGASASFDFSRTIFPDDGSHCER